LSCPASRGSLPISVRRSGKEARASPARMRESRTLGAAELSVNAGRERGMSGAATTNSLKRCNGSHRLRQPIRAPLPWDRAWAAPPPSGSRKPAARGSENATTRWRPSNRGSPPFALAGRRGCGHPRGREMATNRYQGAGDIIHCIPKGAVLA
jgi:hypothetical protein